MESPLIAPSRVVLPPTQVFRQCARHGDGWSDHYGALRVAADYCGRASAGEYFVRGLWQHGCFGPWQEYSPGVLVYHAPGAQRLPIYVARREQADHLRRHGYPHARAIGMPIVYAPEPALPRLPGSLLVVPTHSLAGFIYPDRTPFERYADEIVKIAAGFQSVTVCVHPNCQQNGLWVKEFAERGFEIVFGARTGDANALGRMRALFAQFESVTTNDWGSHVAYALAFGAKVSIAGIPMTSDWSVHLRDACWAANPDALKRAFSTEVLDRQREFLKPFYAAAPAGTADVALGRWLIGADEKISEAEMAEILGDLMDPPPIARVRPAAGEEGRKSRILFVVSDAGGSAGSALLLDFLQWLRSETKQNFEVVLRGTGPREAEFHQWATVRPPDFFARNPAALGAFDLIYSDASRNGSFLEGLPYGDIPIVTQVHEGDAGHGGHEARDMAAVIRQCALYLAGSPTAADRLGRIFRIPGERIVVAPEMSDRWRELQRCLDLPGPAPTDRGQAVALAEIYATWSVEDAPERAYVAAHLARARTRQRARELAGQRQTKAAIQVLVRAVRTDLAAKDPLAILESLAEIAGDLAPLEPRLSAQFLAELGRISPATRPADLGDFGPKVAAGRPVPGLVMA
jgi:hypothetical protein